MMNIKEALEAQQAQQGSNKKLSKVEVEEQPKAAKKAAEKIKEEINKIELEDSKKDEKQKGGLFNFAEDNDFCSRLISLHFYKKCDLGKPKKDYVNDKKITDLTDDSSIEEVTVYVINALIQKAMESIPFTPFNADELVSSAIDCVNSKQIKVTAEEDKVTVILNGDTELKFRAV